MSKKLGVLISTIIGLVVTAVITIVTKLDFSWAWILAAVLGTANEIANIIIEYFTKEKK